ncbi:uncharacterized protein PGTG_05926 [Puccinia graminis f. sp. tritici CRL 75-36-700-3]|uniref:sterol 3beta-glucosyltransferase n=2 Tax=Puccinia graminis f. sp. tritici TaxID=56615 RepID=E3K634_PUCGT|nr:uncharacterized protein PGTG_05926 [Puccinia graminis f. sp. tritici CRL 75-36-700-3]EFP79605.2 hypothetical protein PGTG_05926 [Puccinia graminis f. sp. tritici CRL 75-36-700-3]
MMGSTASLVGMLKAAALSSFQNLDQTLRSEDSSSIGSTGSASEEEIISEQAAKELVSDVNSPDEDGLAPKDAHLCEGSRVFINKFASTLIHQDNPGVASQLSFSPGSPANRFTNRSAGQPVASSSSTHSSDNSLQEDGKLLESAQSPVTVQEHLKSVIDHFGPWTETDGNGQPEPESWIKQIPGILTRSVLVQGSILLTNRRLCYVAYLPPVDTKDLIRSGSITVQCDGIVKKATRMWAELRTDCVTLYRSSTKLFRPLHSLHLSEIKHVLPISSTHPKILQLRLRTGEIVDAKFDTAEATSAWHAGFVSALFTFKTYHSKKIMIMIPLRRIRKIHRNTFENIAQVMSVDVDCAPCFRDIVDNDIIEGKFTLEDFDRTRIQLSYFLSCGNFDDLILDAIVRAKLEVSQAESLASHRTPPPLLKITSSHSNEEDSENEEKLSDHVGNFDSSENALADKFVKAFGLEANTKLPIYPCLLLRTLPSPGHVAISQDYLCFWYRGIPVLGSDYKLKIPLKSVGNLKRTSAFGFHRFGLAIETLGAPDVRLDFTSKSTREEVIEGLKAAVQDSSSRESNRLQDFQPLSSRTPGAVAEPNFTLPRCGQDTMPVLIGGAKIDKIIKPLRIVCLTIGSRGDVQPYISLAKRLMQDGHTVTIASHPEYRTWVESFGILYKDVGGDPGALMNFSVEHSFFSTGFFKEGLGYFKTWLNNLFMEAWVATKESQAELLIESPSTFSGIHIAEALRIPYFRAFTMTWTSTTTYPQAFASGIDLGPSYNLLSYSLFDSLIWRAMSGQVNRWRKETLGIPPTSLEQMQSYKVPFMYNFSSAVVPKPLDWRDHIEVTGYWFLDQSHGNFQPPESLLKFIASAKEDKVPLIYIGFGSVTVPDSTTVTRSIYAAVVQAGVRAIVAKGWSDRVEAKSTEQDVPPPQEVYVLQSVPHDWLFPQVDAVCHHGGAGTTGISLKFGIPTIIHPFFGDQTFWADRVARLGAGLKIDSLSVNTLCEAFNKATSDRIIKEKAEQIKEQIQAEDGPSRAVQFIYQHLDFALERTIHRIERTRPKKTRRSKSAESPKSEMTGATSNSGGEDPRMRVAHRDSMIKRKFTRRGRSTNRTGTVSTTEAEDVEPNLDTEPSTLAAEPSGLLGKTSTFQPGLIASLNQSNGPAVKRLSKLFSTTDPPPTQSDFNPSPIDCCPSGCDPLADSQSVRRKSYPLPFRRRSLFSSLPKNGIAPVNSVSKLLRRTSPN